MNTETAHRAMKQLSRMTRIPAICLALCIALCLTAGCGLNFKSSWPYVGYEREDAAQSEQEAGPLRIGLATDAPPLSWRDDEGMRGLEPQLAASYAAGVKSAGREVIYAPMPKQSLFEALRSGQVDVVMGGITEREARQQKLAATRGWLKTGLTPLTLLGEEKRLSGKGGLKAPGLRIGTVLGSSGPAYVRGLRAKGTHQVFSGAQPAVNALLARRIDVLVHDMPANFHYAARHIEEGLMPGDKLLTRDEIVWVLRDGDRALRRSLDAWLKQKQDDDTLAALVLQNLPFYSETGAFKKK